jgi:hypothetical protein
LHHRLHSIVEIWNRSSGRSHQCDVTHGLLRSLLGLLFPLAGGKTDPEGGPPAPFEVGKGIVNSSARSQKNLMLT